MARRKVHKSIADKEILTMEEAAEYMTVNRITLLEMIREGKIPASKLRFRWRLKKTDIDYYVRHGKNPVAVEREKEKERERARKSPEKSEKKASPPKRVEEQLGRVIADVGLSEEDGYKLKILNAIEGDRHRPQGPQELDIRLDGILYNAEDDRRRHPWMLWRKG